MYLFSCIGFGILFCISYKFFYKPYLENHKDKKLQKQKKEDRLKSSLLNCHPEFIGMYNEFKLDQEEKRKNGYHSDMMISVGGYTTKIYGKYVFVYDQYFENCFYQNFNNKYNELVKNPNELEKVMELIQQSGY